MIRTDLPADDRWIVCHIDPKWQIQSPRTGLMTAFCSTQELIKQVSPVVRGWGHHLCAALVSVFGACCTALN
jgi:hypothetical protein